MKFTKSLEIETYIMNLFKELIVLIMSIISAPILFGIFYYFSEKSSLLIFIPVGIFLFVYFTSSSELEDLRRQYKNRSRGNLFKKKYK